MPVINRTTRRRSAVGLMTTFTVPCLDAPACEFEAVDLDPSAAHDRMREHYLAQHLEQEQAA